MRLIPKSINPKDSETWPPDGSRVMHVEWGEWWSATFRVEDGTPAWHDDDTPDQATQVEMDEWWIPEPPVEEDGVTLPPVPEDW